MQENPIVFKRTGGFSTGEKEMVEKFFKFFQKKVLTKRAGFDIIVKRSREAEETKRRARTLKIKQREKEDP